MHITGASKYGLCNIYNSIIALRIMKQWHQLKSHKLQQFNASVITNIAIIISCDPLHIQESIGAILWQITYIMFIICEIPIKHIFQITHQSTTILQYWPPDLKQQQSHKTKLLN